MGIQRYRGARATKLVPAENGEAVLFADHVAETAALVRELKEYRSLHSDCEIIKENGYDKRCSECKCADELLDGQP